MSTVIAGDRFLARALAQRLASRGEEVWWWSNGRLVPNGPGPRALPSRLRAAYFLMPARPHVFDYNAAVAAFVDGQVPCERFVLASSITVYGDCGGDWVDESTAPRAQGALVASLLEAEARLAATESAVILRFGALYSAREDPWCAKLLSGEATRAEGPPLYVNRLHRDDAARVLVHAREIERGTYNAVDTEPVALNVLLETLAAAVGQPAPPFAPPPVPFKNRRVRCERLRQSGFVWAVPTFREGLPRGGAR